jgi:hypothetical protein
LQSGFAGIKFAAATIAISGLLALASQADAAELSLSVTGNLVGLVVDSQGAPQMGATVQLLNRYERVLAKAMTASDGSFVFAGLPINTYAIRVSQPSFLPAFRDRIAIQAGSDSYLQIHLATLFSNIQVSYKLPSGAMTNDWKWALRTSVATRPVTRFLPELAPPKEKEVAVRPQIFSDTHALLQLNGGDAGFIDTGDTSADLGSSFALSTNLFGKNQVQIAGSFAQGADMSPAVRGLAAIYRRDSQNAFAGSPEVTLTISQFNGFGMQLAGLGQVPAMRFSSLGLYQVADPLDNFHLEYGIAGETFDYVQHSSRLSPFARATVALSPNTEIIAAFSDGGRPDELTSHSTSQNNEDFQPADELTNAVNALARLPQMSSRDGQLVLQRTQNYELGFSHTSGGRTYAFSGFHENVWNGHLNMSGNLSQLSPADLLFDGISKTSTYNVGAYTRNGYVASVTQHITSNVDIGVAAGRMGGFMPDSGNLSPSQGSFLGMGLRDVAGADLRASIPASGTRISAGYGWVETGAVVPLHVFTTQANVVSPGLNFSLKQPIPSLFGLPGHLELTADLRNLLAQGYVPVGSGGQLLIVQSPRAIRGGLNLTF